MFDRVNDLSASLIGGSSGDGGLGGDALASVLREDERPGHVLASDSVEHETDGRTLTVEPDGENAVALVATDERVLVVLGGETPSVEIAFELGSVTACSVQSGLVNRTLHVENGAESVRISSSYDDLQDVQSDIERVAERYREIEAAVGTAEDLVEQAVSTIRTDGEGEPWATVASTLAEAREHATRDTGGHPLERSTGDGPIPEEKLLDRIERARTELRRRYAEAWIDRAEGDIERARDALGDGENDAFCAAYVVAGRARSTLREVVDDADGDLGDVEERVREVSDRVVDLGETYVEAIEDAHGTATTSEDPETAATAWLEVHRRIAAARRADWEGTDGTVPIGAVIPEESVPVATVEALERHARALERAGEDYEDDTEQARERYERATERLREAREIAHGHASVGDREFEDRLATLEEKIDRTKWEWGRK